jgi:hypothetical protein
VGRENARKRGKRSGKWRIQVRWEGDVGRDCIGERRWRCGKGEQI